jgi:hypothetical protein
MADSFGSDLDQLFPFSRVARDDPSLIDLSSAKRRRKLPILFATRPKEMLWLIPSRTCVNRKPTAKPIPVVVKIQPDEQILEEMCVGATR